MAWVEIDWPPGAAPMTAELGRGLIFGRSAEAEVFIDDESVSAKHAWIREVGGRYILIDLRSTNGVSINGMRVEEGVLHNGDTFGLADVVCRFHNPMEVMEPVMEQPPQAPHELEHTETKAGATRVTEVIGKEPVLQCPACAYLVPGHLEFCPRCKQPMKGVRFIPEDLGLFDSDGTRRFVRAMSSLAFAGGLVGPLLLGVGWVLGIVLGVMILSGYRPECDEQDVKMARRGVLLGLLWLTAMLWAFLRLWGMRS
ncbi:MAG: FHA domain-containing protein [Kiritimatiellae bacterium]|nr:FHA domain-containing protein [Kiritimatiellia bacterium]